jgi:fibronectin type 3 domain-containing protein
VVLRVSPGEAGTARTVLPGKNQVFSRYELVFSREDADDVTVSDTSAITGAGINQELAAGTWTATVSAYNRFTPTDGDEKEYLAAQGSGQVSVTAGQLVSVTVNLAPVKETGVKGIFTYTVTFPSENTAHTAALTLGDYTVALTSGEEVSVEVDPGYYDLTITLSDAGTVKGGAAEKVHIYSGLESKAEYIFDENFSLLKGPGDNVKAETQSAASILVSWDSVPGASYYKVYRSESVDGEYELVWEGGQSTTTSHTDGGLSPDTIYYYKVSAVTGGREGPLSDYAFAVTKVSAPSNPRADNEQSSNSIKVSWDSVPGASSYKVYRTENNYSSYTLAGSSTGTSYTDTGLSPSRPYYYRISAVGIAGEGAQSESVSASTISEAEDTRIEGVYIGIIPFAGTANDLGLVRLNAAGRRTLVNQLNSSYNTSAQSGTALFYAVHTALANLKSRETRYPPDLESVNVVTFTDGLDNGSTGISALTPIEKQVFESESEYTTYLSGEISGRTIADKSITAYSVGIRGADVTDSSRFENDLENLASQGNSRILTDFGNLQTTFQGIADNLQITQTASTTFTMKTTLLSSGAKVRMTFDITGKNASEAEASSKYIEGTISRTGTGDDMVYTFNDIRYAGGLGSDLGAGPITGAINGTEVSFVFTGVTGYDPSTDESRAKQWTKAPGATAWQVNSEYSVTGATNTEIDSLSSIIYLVLDSSTSLNQTQIGQIMSAAIAFINSLYSQLNALVSSGVSATMTDLSSIRVSWNPVPNTNSYTVSNYRVYRSDSEDGVYSQVGSNISSTSTSWTNTGLSPNTTYYYKVSAYMYDNSYNYWETAQSSYASASIVPSSSSGISNITYGPEPAESPEWTLESGMYKSPTIEHGAVTKERISFTSAGSDASIVIQLSVSSERDCDWAFIGEVDNAAATYNTGIVRNLSGENTTVVTIPVPSTGNHFIDVGYRKDGSENKGSDCAWFKVIE